MTNRLRKDYEVEAKNIDLEAEGNINQAIIAAGGVALANPAKQEEAEKALAASIISIKNLAQKKKTNLKDKLTLGLKIGKSRQLVNKLLKQSRFGKKQKKLLRKVSTLKPVKAVELKRETSSKNLKSLIRDTNKKITRQGLIIKSLYREEGTKGYYRLEVFALSLETNS